jgi:hypothetical protein
MEGLAKAIREENVAIRLSPLGLYNQARGMQRAERWGHLCRELKRVVPRMIYVSFIEPVSEKRRLLKMRLRRGADVFAAL